MGMLKYIIKYALYLAHYNVHFHINDDVKERRHLVSQIILYSCIIHLDYSHIKYCKKYALPWMRMLCHGYTNKNYLFLYLV